MENYERLSLLKKALTGLYKTGSVKYYLGEMPEGIDNDLWEMVNTLQSALEARIAEVSELE